MVKRPRLVEPLRVSWVPEEPVQSVPLENLKGVKGELWYSNGLLAKNFREVLAGTVPDCHWRASSLRCARFLDEALY